MSLGAVELDVLVSKSAVVLEILVSISEFVLEVLESLSVVELNLLHFQRDTLTVENVWFRYLQILLSNFLCKAVGILKTLLFY